MSNVRTPGKAAITNSYQFTNVPLLMCCCYHYFLSPYSMESRFDDTELNELLDDLKTHINYQY